MINFQTNSINQSHYKYNSFYNANKNKQTYTKEFAEVKITDEVEKTDVQEQEACDVRNASFKEIQKVALDLLESGEIDRGEYVVMVFDYSTLIPHIQQSNLTTGNQFPIQIQNNPMFEGYDNKKHDWLDIFERKSDQQLKLGNRDGYQSYLKIKNALETTLDR